MGITEVSLSDWNIYIFNSLYFLVLAYTCYRSPWGVIKSTVGLQHLCFGASVFLVLLWSIEASISQGFTIHFLGLTALTLVLGWDLAIVCASLSLAVLLLFTDKITLANFSTNGVITVLLPVLIAQIVFKIVDRKLPKNFFIYLFLCGFFCAGFTAMMTGFSVAFIFWLNDIMPWANIQRDIVTVIPLIIFPEGLLNGVLLTAIMVFYPDWVRTFDAKVYIDDQ